MKQSAVARWEGSKNEGKGITTNNSKTIVNTPFSFIGEDDNKTNPAELIAAAHADCFTLFMTVLLDQHHLTPEIIETKAEVTVDDDPITMTHSHLTVKAKIPNITKEQFGELAVEASKTCPVSRLLKAEISVDYELVE